MRRSKDLQLDLNNPRMKVPTDDRECWNITSACTACDGLRIMLYECELRYQKEQSPFRCKHNELMSNLKCKQGGDPEIIPARDPKWRASKAGFPVQQCHTTLPSWLAQSKVSKPRLISS